MATVDWMVLTLAVASIAVVNWYFFSAGRTIAAPMMVKSGADASAAFAEAVITVDGGYSPNTVRAAVGQPLRLVFDRRDDSSCSEEIVIPAFGIRKYLPTGQRTVVEVTPTTAGRIPFTCGMGMLKGTVLVDG
jgi:plastocyanin domain-containing protein